MAGFPNTVNKAMQTDRVIVFYHVLKCLLGCACWNPILSAGSLWYRMRYAMFLLTLTGPARAGFAP